MPDEAILREKARDAVRSGKLPARRPDRTWGGPGVGAPCTILWRLCKTYGRLIGYPQLKPHDLRHGVAMEVYEQHGDLEQVRGLLGHARIDTTQVYAQIRPAQLKQSVAFYEGKALEALTK
jgi:integrase